MIQPREPRIIGPDEHPIRHKLIDPDAMKVLRMLGDNGYAGYLVGGGVRDLYLGRSPKDFDISTDARPGQIRKLFRNSRTIGRRFRLVQVFFHGKEIEVSTLRSLSEYDLEGPEQVLAPNNTYGSLGEDAQRRDLTINGLFYEIVNDTIIDYVGGINDLDASCVRFIGEPDRRITRDPVRMLRAVRHSARMGFGIDQESWDAICRNHDKLTLCPSSRLRDEFFKDLHSGALGKWLPLALDSELFFDLFGLYRRQLSQKENDNEKPYRVQLQAIAEVIDRCENSARAAGRKGFGSEFLLALFLIPWAKARFDLVNRPISGPDSYRFLKKIRSELDENLGQQLNLRRSIRQDMVTLLSHLPKFVHYQKQGELPKWLRKKSYFKNCLQFCELYTESVTGVQAEVELPAKPAAPPVRRGRGGPGNKTRYQPAFSSRPGGVFGMNRKGGGKKKR